MDSCTLMLTIFVVSYQLLKIPSYHFDVFRNPECDVVEVMRRDDEVLCTAYDFPQVVVTAPNSTFDLLVLHKGETYQDQQFLLVYVKT